MSVARTSAWLTLLNALTQASSFILFAAIAALFGANWQTDAFFLALAVPALVINPLNNSVASAFIPLLTKYRVLRPEALGGVLGSALVHVSIFAVLASVALALAVPLGLSLVGGQLQEHTERLAREHILLLLPMIVAQAASSVLGAAYNAAGRFATPAAAAATRYLATLLLVVVLRPALGVTSLPIAFSGASLVQLVLLAARWTALATPLRFTRAVDPPARRSLWLALPLMAGNTLQQFGFLISRVLAAHLSEGSVSVLDYASRLAVGMMELVTSGVFLVTLADWSEVVARSRTQDLRRKLGETLRLVLFIIAPIAGLTVGLAVPLVTLVFERGAFAATFTPVTAAVLALLALAMPFDAIARCYLRVLLVWEELWTAAAIATLRLVFTVVTAVALLGSLGVRGLAVADGLAVLVIMAVMVNRVDRRLGPVLREARGPLLRISLAGGVALGFAAAAAHALSSYPPAVVFILGSVGAGVTFAAAAYLLRVDEVGRLLAFLRTPWQRLNWSRPARRPGPGE